MILDETHLVYNNLRYFFKSMIIVLTGWKKNQVQTEEHRKITKADFWWDHCHVLKHLWNVVFLVVILT